MADQIKIIIFGQRISSNEVTATATPTAAATVAAAVAVTATQTAVTFFRKQKNNDFEKKLKFRQLSIIFR